MAYDPVIDGKAKGAAVLRRRAALMLLGAGLAAPALPALAEVMERSPRPVARPGPGGAPAASGGKGASAADDIPRLIEAAKLGGTVAFAVLDAASGEVLSAREVEAQVPPASVAKAITALYALDRLGPAHRFVTRVLATGPVQGGIVQGDIVLAGGGDPTLQTDQLGDLVARLAGTGVRGATGRFLHWAGALPQIDRISDDQPDHVGYNPAISGLNLNFNRVHFEWKRAAGGGWGVAMDARGERFVPPVRMTRMQVVSREAPLFTYDSRGGAEDWTVASVALGKGGSRWLPVRRPADYVAEVFRTLAAAQGIDLPEPRPATAVPAGAELAHHESEALPEVLRDMLRFSTNLTAEAVGLTASGAGGLGASAAAMADWARTRLGLQARFADHSGLGSASRVTAASMAGALVAARAQGLGVMPILRSYPMRDDAGKEIAGHPVKVVAKSGTLNFVSGLAGHILPPGGRELCFAVFAADPARRDALPRAEREDPPGGAAWTRRARRLQGQLIRRWAEAHG